MAILNSNFTVIVCFLSFFHNYLSHSQFSSSDDLLEDIEFLSVCFLYQREKAVCGSGSLAQRDPFSPIKSIVEGTLPLQCA